MRAPTTTAMLVVLAANVCVLSILWPTCESRRVVPAPRFPPFLEPPLNTANRQLDSSGWRPVIDSRVSYEPSGSDGMDQTADLLPPPLTKLVKKVKTPTKSAGKGTHPELSASETRVTSAGFTLAPSEVPTRQIRFPDDKRRGNNARPSRPSGHQVQSHPQSHRHYHHHHVTPSAYASAESTQSFRFRPSPQVPQHYENPFPSWLVPQSEQASQVYLSPDNAELLRLQQQLTRAEISLAQQQQQADGARHPVNTFIPSTQHIYGNPQLFGLEQQKVKTPNTHLYLVPSNTAEPPVHENEVPQGPAAGVVVTHTSTRVVPFDVINADRFPVSAATVPPFAAGFESVDTRPRRPRPPTGIQAQLEFSRRPIFEGADQVRYRHPRPTSTEAPAWPYPTIDPLNFRPRRPSPTPIVHFVSNEVTTPEPPIRVRRPLVPNVQDIFRIQEFPSTTINPLQVTVVPYSEGINEFGNLAPTQTAALPPDLGDIYINKPRRPIPTETNVNEDAVEIITREPNLLREQTTEIVEVHDIKKLRRPRPQVDIGHSQNSTVVRRRRPRPPSQLEGSGRPLRPRPNEDQPWQPLNEDDTDEHENKPHHVQEYNAEDHTEKPTTLSPVHEIVEETAEVSKEILKVDVPDTNHQEDVDDVFNARPRRPRPQVDADNPRVRRPRPPTDLQRRRRPRPPNGDGQQPQRRRPQRPTEESGDEHEAFEHQWNKETEQELEKHQEQSSNEYVSEAPATHSPTTTSRVPSVRKKATPLSSTDEKYPESTSAATTTSSTTQSTISTRLRARLNSTRPRFSVGDYKTRLSNRLSAGDTSTKKPEPEDVAEKTAQNMFNLGTSTTTALPTSERSTFVPSATRFVRPSNKYYTSRYRASTEEPSTASQQDATRRTSPDLYSRERKPPPGIKMRTTTVSSTEEPITSEPILTTAGAEVTTLVATTETDADASTTEDISTSVSETTTAAAAEGHVTPHFNDDFSPAKRVTDLTSSATAFKPLSFFSAVPADGKPASQLSSRFTMATEDPILPIQAFFPTFTTRPQSSYNVETA